MDFIITLLFALLAFFGGGEAQPTSADERVKVLRVIDGDTIVVQLNGVEQTVRYIGIDTPEPYAHEEPDCYSQEASLRNQELVENKIVTLSADYGDKDKYGRLLRYVYIDDVFVNELLVTEGFAKSMTIKPNTTHASKFIKLETQARENNLGLWSECQ